MMPAFLQNLESFLNASLQLCIRFAFGTFRFGRNADFSDDLSHTLPKQHKKLYICLKQV